MEELVPILEREGDPAQDQAASGGLGRDLASGRRHDPGHRLEERPISLLRAAYILFRRDMGAMIRDAGPAIAHVHVADTYNHKASSGLRYICNPPGARVTIHQHLDIGQGEIDWDLFFSSLAAIGFDGIMTACVFAWEERADESGRYMRETMQKYVDKYSGNGRKGERARGADAPDTNWHANQRKAHDTASRRDRRRNDRPGAHKPAGAQARRREGS